MTTETLTPEQAAAVEATDAHRVVVAGAGTGKTRTLAAAVTNLVERGIPRHEIACITFARSAALELRQRIDATVDGGGAGIYVGTSHGLALDVVEAATGTMPTLLTDDDCLEIIKVILRQSTGLSGVTSREVLDAIKVGDFSRPKIMRVAQGFLQRVPSAGAIASFDLFGCAAHRLRDGAAGAWKDRCSTLLIDEAQDIAPDEWGFLLALQPDRSFVVGDPRQAIFGFRGGMGEIRPVCAAGERHASFALTESFRCGDTIARASHSFDSGPTDERLRGWSEDGCSGEVSFAVSVDDLDLSGSSTAILARTNREVTELRDLIGSALGPHYCTAPPQPAKGAKLARMLVRWVANPSDPMVDTVAVRRLLGERATPTHEASAGRVVEVVAANLKTAINGNLKGYDRQTAWGYLDRMSAAAERGGVMTAGDWLADEATETIDDVDVGLPYIGTIHSAKGREWDTVIVRMDRGFPHHLADIAEERKLAYVAVTRARKSLCLWSDSPETASDFVGNVLEGLL